MYPSQLHGSAQHRQQENDRQWQHFLEYTRQQRLAQQPSGPVPDLTPTQQADLREYFNRQKAELDLARQQCGDTRDHVARHSAASAKLEKQLDNTCNLNQASPLASVYTHTDTHTSTRTDKHTHKGNLEVAVTKGTTNLTVTHTHTHTHTPRRRKDFRRTKRNCIQTSQHLAQSTTATPKQLRSRSPQLISTPYPLLLCH